MSNNEEIIKKKISDELKNKELTDLIIKIIYFLIPSVIFGYIGYSFCIDNNYDIQKGIVFGSLFPVGLALLKELTSGRTFTYIGYTIIYLILIDYLHAFVGIILLIIIILMFIAFFISIIKKDRTEEVNKIYKTEYCKPIKKINNKNLNQYISKKSNFEETKYNQIQEEYECERCFKRISEEEYDLHDGMCEECFDDTLSY